MKELDKFQWFIITAIGGQEESIAQTLREKMTNYGYSDRVKEIAVFMKTIYDEKEFSKNDPELPTTLKNTRTISWETLPSGKYKRTKTKIVNRFPGYIFINMIMDSDIWYAIRNTIGVLGFVGSTGKGSMPIPITVSEFQTIIEQDIKKEEEKLEQKIQAQQEVEVASEKPKEKKAFSTNLKVGNNVIIMTGSFADTGATISSINLEKGTATVEVEFFGRVNSFDVSLEDLKLED